MIDQTKKIIWMADESLGNSDPVTWDKILELQRQFIQLAGNDELEHEILDPRICWRNLIKQIRGQDFTTIIDLSGMLSTALRELFPNAAIIDDFHISRVREVSTPGLPTTGHTSSLSLEQIRRKKQQLDLSRVLIVDDTSFSGTSSEVAMTFWGLQPKKTSHAFLLANTGVFPSPEGNKPGAVQKLEQAGSRVFFGHEIHTPTEDGWHLKDLTDHRDIEKALQLCLTQPKNRREVLCTQSFTTEEILSMVRDGRMLLKQQPSETGIHAKNPFLWTTDGIWEHISKGNVQLHQDEIVQLLLSIRLLTTQPEGKTKAQEGFHQETMLLLKGRAVEGTTKRKEEL